MIKINSEVLKQFGKKGLSINEGIAIDLATNMSLASYLDSPYLSYCTVQGFQTDPDLKKVYADKGYHDEPNRDFLSLNHNETIIYLFSEEASLSNYKRSRNILFNKLLILME